MTDPSPRSSRRDRPRPGFRAPRWLRTARLGPLARIRRAVGVTRTTVRGSGSWRAFPEALATALLAPLRAVGGPAPESPPRDWSSERSEALSRLATARAGREPSGSLRLALIAGRRIRSAAEELFMAVVAIRPEDWRLELERAPPDLLVVTSTRTGNDGAWSYRIGWYAHPDSFLLRDLGALLEWCRGRGIPSIFLATDEDHLAQAFGDAAAGFDLIVLATEASAEAAAFAAHPRRRGAGVRILSAEADPQMQLEAVCSAMAGLVSGSAADEFAS